MEISAFRPRGPAAKAGIAGGDIIIKLGNDVIKNFYDFTYALGEHKLGVEVEVVTKRGAQTRTVRVILERRN
jgi:S1-C subfamily serine protease